MPRVHAALLGDSFAGLPGSLRKFHGEGAGGRVTGVLEVRREAGMVRRALCSLLRLPNEADAVHVVLTVRAEGDREHWRRRFAGRRLDSTMRARRGRLIERFGVYTFGYRLEMDGFVLRYRYERAWLLGVPLPRWLALGSNAECRGDETGWVIDSLVFAPLLGPLARYHGRVELQ